MPKSRLKSVSKHKNNIATPAKREYKFFDVAKIKLPKPQHTNMVEAKFINDFLVQVDNTHQSPEVVIL